MKWRRGRYLVVIGGAVVLIAVIAAVVIILTGTHEGPTASQGLLPGQTAPGEARPVTNLVWPATLLLHVDIDPAQQADQPADVALVDGKMFLVDTGGGRLLEVSADGKTSHVLDKQVDPKLTLSLPMAITSNQGQLYVADTEGERVLVVSPSGSVSRTITLAKGDPSDALPPRALGIVVWADGSFAISDANNNRLNKYDSQGNLVWTIGAGAPSSGETGFNVPGGLALDKDGNVYVVDIVNSQVKKYSTDGKFLFAFGGPGDTAGAFSRPKAVAVDDAGNIYVSDGLQVAVQVFDQTGNFVGFIGRKDPADPNSDSLFQAPHGLKIIDNKLYVVDRYNGLFVFQLPTPQQQTATTQ